MPPPEDPRRADGSAARLRVMVLLTSRARRGEARVATEHAAIAREHDLRTECLDTSAALALSYDAITAREQARVGEAIARFRPHVLHTHHLSAARLVEVLARRFAVPFTVRSHSHDVVVGPSTWWPGPSLVDAVDALNGEHCAGVLAFAHYREVLERAGVRADRIIESPPLVDFERFHDRAPNGAAVMAAGPASPQRRMTDFVDIACRVRSRRFDLYAPGPERPFLARYDAAHGSPVHLHARVPHADMPAIYKAHAWLVRTDAPISGASGWPASLVEAQAAGVGVCVAATHARAAEPLGGAGFVYRHVDEAAAIVSRPYPDELRELGFEVARRCDARRHVHDLGERWRALARMPA